MARQATGYVSVDGKFFDNDIDCDLYDAAYDLQQTVSELIQQSNLNVTDEEAYQYAKKVIWLNKDTIKEYIAAKEAAWERDKQKTEKEKEAEKEADELYSEENKTTEFVDGDKNE